MNTYKMVAAVWSSMSKYSKFMIKYGTIYLVALVTASQAFRVAAGIMMDYYSAIDISEQLFKCINPSIGIIGLGIVLFECAYHSLVKE